MARARSASISGGGARTRKPIGEMTWTEINTFLRDASEAEALVMLQEEKAGQSRPMVKNRIFCRFNKMRGERERREL
jgi:hypothetical protein